MLAHGSTGVFVPLSADGSHLALAHDLEGLGYDALWIAGGQLDDTARVTELLGATRTARIATGIVPLGVFPTDAIAALHAAVDPARFVLGLGGAQQDRPMAALRTHLDELDAAGVPPHRRMLAALGPQKLRVARDRTAGAITMLTTPASTADTRARLGAGPTLAVHMVVVLESDAASARAASADMLGFLAQVPGYRAHFARMGFADLDDRWVDAVTCWGDAATIAARVGAHRAAGADHVAVSILTSDGGEPVPVTATALASELGLRSDA